MIILFTYNGGWLKLIYFIRKHIEYKFIILTKFNKTFFEKADVIIPFGMNSQLELYKYRRFKHKFLINKLFIYEQLDNKNIFYELCKQYNFNKKTLTNIRLIKDYNKYKGDNIYGKFYIKPIYGQGAEDNLILEDSIYNIINKYSKTHQIQEYIDIKNVIGINCVCKNGDIIEGIQFTTQHNLVEDDFYEVDHNLLFQNIQKKYFIVVKNIIKEFNYNGFIEVEFIQDYSDNIYLMECNPRTSGLLMTKTFDNYYPYKELLNAYIKIIKKQCYKPIIYNKVNQLSYIGNYTYPKLYLCHCGCGKVINKNLNF